MQQSRELDQESSDFMATLKPQSKKMGVGSPGSRAYCEITGGKYSKALDWINELNKK